MQGECDEWTGARGTKHGVPSYGVIKIAGEQHYVHRIVWMQDNGPLPDGWVVMHLCDNPICINIDHLKAGTYSDNTQDQIRKGRHPQLAKTHCKRGHEFTESSTYKDTKGYRRCRPCRKITERERTNAN